MRLKKSHIVKLFITALVIAAATSIVSLTVGKDIYYGPGNGGLLSFGIVNFSGYLFFLIMPVELAFIYYLAGDINILVLNAVVLGTAMFSQAVDYYAGYILSTKAMDHLIRRERYIKAEQRIRAYGNITIFLFNVTPLSSPVISLAAGVLRYRIKDAATFTFMGLLIKYTLLTLFFR